MGQYHENVNVDLYAFNRGLISKKALSRTDLSRTSLSSVIQENYLPRELGAMSIRPGFSYKANTASDNKPFGIPFIFSTVDTALIEFTDGLMRVLVSDALITRPAVTAAITNGTFTSQINDWEDDDAPGAVSIWWTGNYMRLTGTGTAAAKRYQQVTVNEKNIEHAVRIVINRGPVTCRIGSTQGDDDYITETELSTGEHSLAFTPSGNFFIEFENYTLWSKFVESAVIESSGTMMITSPYAEADLSLIRHDQSGNVVFIASGYKQRRVERRANNSWSIVDYEANDGPFRLLNSTPITISSSALTGDVTLTASAALFKSGHVDALFSLIGSGQAASVSAGAENTFTTDDFRVVGIGGQRSFTLIITGTWSATVTLQYSVGAPGSWIDFATYTTNQSRNISDGLDNSIIYWRAGIKTGGYTSGTAVIEMTYTGGIQVGLVRLRTVASATSATASVISALGSTDGTSDWEEGAWSTLRGYPSAVKIYESRMCWAGKDNFWASINDIYDGFDPDFEGDAQPINRSIGFGPVDTINWLEIGDWLMGGGQGAELSIRSSSDQEPLTRTNLNIKAPSTQGSANMAAVKIDESIIFVDKSGTEVYELAYSLERNNKKSRELTIHIPEIGKVGFVKMAVQRKPDTRVHLIRNDGVAVVLLFNKAEDILAFVEVITDGTIEDVVVLPGTTEDQVYYAIKRTINSSTVRHWEKWALDRNTSFHTTIYNEPEDAAITVISDLDYIDGTIVTVRDSSATKIENLTVTDNAITLSVSATYAHITPSICHLLDSYIEISQSSRTEVSGLGVLEGESVRVWADGRYAGAYTVSSGVITLTIAAEEVVVGKHYQARWQSTKLAYAANKGTSMNQVKEIKQCGLTLVDTHHLGLKVGQDFNAARLRQLPQVFDGITIADDTVYSEFDQNMMTIANINKTDQRLCLVTDAPFPCTVTGLTLGITAHER